MAREKMSRALLIPNADSRKEEDKSGEVNKLPVVTPVEQKMSKGADSVTTPALELSDAAIADNPQGSGLGVTEVIDSETGELQLFIRFAAVDYTAPVYSLNCSDWLRHSGLAKDFAEGFFRHYRNGSWRAHTANRMQLSQFFDFIDATAAEIPVYTVDDINEGTISRYAAWLELPRGEGDAGRTLEDSSKAAYFQSLKLVLLKLCCIPSHCDRMDPSLHHANWNPWPNNRKSSNPRRVLSIDEIIGLDDACLKEMDIAVKRFEDGENYLIEYAEKIPPRGSPPKLYKDPGICLAALVSEFGIPLPPQNTLTGCSPWSSVFWTYRIKYRDLHAHLYPTPRMLVPFVLMYVKYSMHNAEQALTLRWSEISESDVLFGDDRLVIHPSKDHEQDSERVSLTPHKNRAGGKVQPRSFPTKVKDLDNPAVILKNMKRMTQRIRCKVDTFFHDRVFLFVPLGPKDSQVPRGYFKSGAPSSQDNAWTVAFKSFISDNGLPNFSLTSLRATGSDMTHRMTGGDTRAQKTLLGNTAEVIYDNYTSDAAKRRGEERLAGIMQMRDRWVETHGKVDARTMAKHTTQRACTPGYECFDPMDSPWLDQIPGKLCTAYPFCVICPFATVNVNNPESLAYLLKLDRTIEMAKTTMATSRYVEVYMPLRRQLHEFWLPQFIQPDVWDKAEALIDKLPPLFIE